MALFDSSHVIDGLEAADQDAVFEALAQKAVELGVTSDASAVVADLRAREGEASTGFGDGIAIPHAKSPNVTAPSIVFARLGAGVEWNALDGEPLKELFAQCQTSTGLNGAFRQATNNQSVSEMPE